MEGTKVNIVKIDSIYLPFVLSILRVKNFYPDLMSSYVRAGFNGYAAGVVRALSPRPFFEAI